MEKFKVGDILILRPLKLVKETKYYSLKFPYNILYKLNLLKPDSHILSKFLRGRTFKERLRYKIESKVPDRICKSALLAKKEEYEFNHHNLTFGVDPKIDRQNGYQDIFADNEYKKNTSFVNINPYLKNTNQDKLVIDKAIIEPESLAYYISKIERENSDESYKEWEQRYNEIKEREYSLEELKKLKEDIIAKEKDKSFIKITEKTQVFVDPVFYHGFSYNAKGDKIYPKQTTKVKKKLFH